MKKRLFLSSLIIVLTLSLSGFGLVYAGIINSGKSLDERWKHEQAYRPNPVLFLHGFAAEDPKKTWREKEVDEKLNEYFKNYFSIGPVLINPSPYEQSRYSYLELISFINFTQPWRSQLIDRNSSVDTYQLGDYYVSTNERSVNDPGWSDKVYEAIQILRQNYKDKNGHPLKVILVCHSMGGLAAREYLTNPKYSYAPAEIEKLILIGVPNLGSHFAILADGLTKARRVGWFTHYLGWLFSSGIDVIDKGVEIYGLIDINGDAVRDMEPGFLGSGFLNTLNNRSQPPGIDYFVIWGNVVNCNITGTLIGRVVYGPGLYLTYGDGVVSKDSQLGTNNLNLKDSTEVKANHGNEAAAAVNDSRKPLLKFLDYTKPEITITSPDPNANPIPVINTLSLNVKGTVSKEYLPADCVLKIQATREEDGITETKKEDKLLYPSDQWNPGDPNSIIAEFDEKIEFDKPGTYTISVTVINPVSTASDIKTTRIKIIIQKPIITIISPNPDEMVTNKRPLIKARVYSPDSININLSSIIMKIDSAIVTPTVNPVNGGPDITLSYTPTSDLNFGSHTITIAASDIYGVSADEKMWSFTVRGQTPIVTDKYPKNGGIIPNISPIDIKARIYSPDGILLDVSSIEMYVNNVKVTPTISPPSGSSDIQISYSLSNNPGPGKRIGVTVYAKDIYGVSATYGSWEFYIFKATLPQTIFWEKIRVDSNQFLNDARDINWYQIVASPGIYSKYSGVDVYAVTYVKFDMTKFITGSIPFPKMYLLWDSYQDSPWGAPITVTVYENMGSTDPGAVISLGTAYDSKVLLNSPPSSASQKYYFDITNLWNAWVAGEKQNKGLILKVTSGSNRSVASIYGEDTKAVDSQSGTLIQSSPTRTMFSTQQDKQDVYPPFF